QLIVSDSCFDGCDAEQRGGVFEQFAAGKIIVEVRVLRQIADPRASRNIRDRVTKYSSRAGCWIDQLHKQLEGGGFSRSVRPEESEDLAALYFEAEIIKRSHTLLFEESNLVVLGEVVDLDDDVCVWVLRSRAHLAVLSRHFPAARRNVSRIIGSGIWSACSRRGWACFSGALNFTSWGTSGSRAMRSGLTTYSIVVTSGAPSTELSLNSAWPRKLLS